MHIFITGGTGRVARALTPYLRSLGHSLVLTERNGQAGSESKDDLGNTIIHGDVLASPQSFGERISECDAVIHLACSSNPAISQADPTLDMQTNVLGTLALFTECVSQRVPKFIFASSGGTVYGVKDLATIPEHAPLAPVSMHGAMKAATEAYLLAAAHGSGTALQIMRISNPYGLTGGPQQHGFIDVAIRRLTEHRKIDIWGDGSVVRDYIYRTDLVAAFGAALTHDEPFILNIGSGVGTSINEIIIELGNHYDLSTRVERLPGRSIDVARNVLDISASQRVLQWRPDISIADGIRRLVSE